MKKHLLALVSLLLGVFSLSWAQLPEFSTPNAPIYYHIFFTNGGSYYVVDKGAGQQIVTAASAGEGGKWAFIGTGADDGSFYLLSALGNYVKTGDRLTTVSSQSSATKWLIDTGKGANYEIHPIGNTNGWNMWGGAGTGKAIGLYTRGDNGNQLQFTSLEVRWPKFQADDTAEEQWYYLKSNLGEYYLADMGLGKAVRSGAIDIDPARQWKFVGSKESFQIVNRLGHYMWMGGKTITSSGDSEEAGSGGGDNSKPLRTQDGPWTTAFQMAEHPSALSLIHI